MKLLLSFSVIFLAFGASAAIDQMDHQITAKWKPRAKVRQHSLGVLGRTVAVRWWSEQPEGSSYHYASVSVLDYDFNRVRKLVDERSDDKFYRTKIQDITLSRDAERLYISLQNTHTDSFLRGYDLATLKRIGYISFYGQRILKLKTVPNNHNSLIVYAVNEKELSKLDSEHKAYFQAVNIKTQRRLKRYTFSETGTAANQMQITDAGHVVFLSNNGHKVKIWNPTSGKILDTFNLGKEKVDQLFLNRKTGEVLISFAKKCASPACDTHVVKLKRLSNTLKELHEFKSTIVADFEVNWQHGILYNYDQAKLVEKQNKIPTIQIDKSEKAGFFVIQNATFDAQRKAQSLENLAFAGMTGNTLTVDFPAYQQRHTIKVEKGSRQVSSIGFESDAQAIWIHYKDGTATRVIF